MYALPISYNLNYKSNMNGNAPPNYTGPNQPAYVITVRQTKISACISIHETIFHMQNFLILYTLF